MNPYADPSSHYLFELLILMARLNLISLGAFIQATRSNAVAGALNKYLDDLAGAP